MKTQYYSVLCFIAFFIFGINSCTTTGTMRCPEMASKRSHPVFLTSTTHHAKHKNDAQTTAAVAKEINAPQQKVEMKPKGESALLSALAGTNSFEIKIPKFMASKISEEEFEKTNNFMSQNSNHKVGLVRNEKGKAYVKAESRNEFIKFTKVVMEQSKSASAMSDEARDILALVGGICGIVAIGLCLVPYVNFISIFPAGPAGIVLGILGLRSERRHKWALLGIILGAVGFTLAIVAMVIYSLFVFGGGFII